MIASEHEPGGPSPDEEARAVKSAVLEFILTAVGLGATHLYLTPASTGIRVTARVEGVVGLIGLVPPHLAEPVMTYVKRSAKIDAARPRRQGSVLINSGGKTQKVIVSVQPLLSGERIEIRFASAGREPDEPGH
jgi:type II secretory ATPase GspE/PulE/Tfp pilus assembly ATPase PilB-like protein